MRLGGSAFSTPRKVLCAAAPLSLLATQTLLLGSAVPGALLSTSVSVASAQQQRPFANRAANAAAADMGSKKQQQQSKGSGDYVEGEISPKATTLIHEALEVGTRGGSQAIHLGSC